MCTVTAVWRGLADAGPSLRVVFNRDERLTRSEATPPHLVRLGPRRAIMPLDPDGGGSWIAANDAGFVCALLNVTRRPVPGALAPSPVRARVTSRGVLVRRLAACGTIDEVHARLRRIDASEFAPFRLLCLSNSCVVEACSDGERLSVKAAQPPLQLMHASSSLGDTRVTALRQLEWESLLADCGATAATQDRFHRLAWPELPHLSVLMTRPDARTVSITTVEVTDDAVSVRYEPRDAVPGRAGLVKMGRKDDPVLQASMASSGSTLTSTFAMCLALSEVSGIRKRDLARHAPDAAGTPIPSENHPR